MKYIIASALAIIVIVLVTTTASARILEYPVAPALPINATSFPVTIPGFNVAIYKITDTANDATCYVSVFNSQSSISCIR